MTLSRTGGSQEGTNRPMPDDRGDDLRRTGNNVASIVLIGFCLLVFAASNVQRVTVDWLVTTRESRLIWVIVGAAVAGALLDRLVVRRFAPRRPEQRLLRPVSSATGTGRAAVGRSGARTTDVACRDARDQSLRGERPRAPFDTGRPGAAPPGSG